jgi:DNA-binding GntR family transcriptional regulator
VGEHLDRWLSSKRSIRSTTRANYERDIRLYLTPTLGRTPLAELRPHHIDDLYNALLSRRPQPATASLVRHLHSTLRAALNSATKRRLLA